MKYVRRIILRVFWIFLVIFLSKNLFFKHKKFFFSGEEIQEKLNLKKFFYFLNKEKTNNSYEFNGKKIIVKKDYVIDYDNTCFFINLKIDQEPKDIKYDLITFKNGQLLLINKGQNIEHKIDFNNKRVFIVSKILTEKPTSVECFLVLLNNPHSLNTIQKIQKDPTNIWAEENFSPGSFFVLQKTENEKQHEFENLISFQEGDPFYINMNPKKAHLYFTDHKIFNETKDQKKDLIKQLTSETHNEPRQKKQEKKIQFEDQEIAVSNKIPVKIKLLKTRENNDFKPEIKETPITCEPQKIEDLNINLKKILEKKILVKVETLKQEEKMKPLIKDEKTSGETLGVELFSKDLSDESKHKHKKPIGENTSAVIKNEFGYKRAKTISKKQNRLICVKHIGNTDKNLNNFGGLSKESLIRKKESHLFAQPKNKQNYDERFSISDPKPLENDSKELIDELDSTRTIPIYIQSIETK